jgi:signal peptidase I
MKNIIYFAITLVAAVAALYCFQLAFRTFEVFDISMEPTYQPGDFIAVNTLQYNWEAPARGDVVALYSPDTTQRLSFNPFAPRNSSQLIKRIIALPGDIVDITDNKVYVNGRPLDEPYIQEPCDYDCAGQTVPAGHYFVLGDNRNHSDDSHRGWLAPKSDIIGKVCLSYWHADYPDIHIVVVPALVLVVGAFSTDAIAAYLKRFTKRP